FVLKLVPRKTVLEHGIVPIGYSGSTLVVAMSDPSNIIAVDDLRFATGYNIKPVVAPERAIQDVIEKHYGMDEVGERIKIERDEEPLEEIIRELEDFKNSVHNSNETLLSQEDAYESERGEFRSDVNPEEGDVLTLRGVISKSDNINEKEYKEYKEYTDSVEVEEEQVVDPFAVPVYSPNHEVAGGREDSISEKEQEEGFDPSILFSQEDEYRREKEEDSGEQSQREEVLKQTSLFHQGFNSTLQSEEVNNDFALELLQEDEAPRHSETFLRSEDEFTSQKGESSFDRDVTADVSVESGLFSPANSFSTPSYEPLSKEEKQPDNPTVIQLYREAETHTPFEFGLEKEQTTRTTVLVVDDSPTIQKIVAITLERKGYQVVTAANAMQALAKLNEVVPDMIFLDINLPHMDGYQVCKIIKANDLTKDVPVVMLSGKDGFFDKVRGRIAGATDYITKPFEPSTLIQAVEKYSG
ncbi:MAG: response regulator, partial [Thermodesulfobacteriota bacterium]